MTTQTFADNTRRPIINTVTILQLPQCEEVAACFSGEHDNLGLLIVLWYVTTHVYMFHIFTVS